MMHEKPLESKGEMGMDRRLQMMKMAWEKLDDDAKKQFMLRKLDEKIMKKECKIKLLQYKIESLRMAKTWVEKKSWAEKK